MSSYSAADDWFDPTPPPRPRAAGDKRSRRRRRNRDHSSPAAALAPLLIGSALAIVSIAGQTKLGAWLRGFFSTRTKTLPPQSALLARVAEGLPLPLLRDSLLGRRKVAVADLLGPPRTAVITRPTMGKIGQAAFWRADTWYYAIDGRTQTAMAVMFDVNGFAGEVDFFDAPQPDDVIGGGGDSTGPVGPGPQPA
jgi:hypothetical protein